MEPPISLQSTVVALPDQVSSRLDDETVVLELKKGAYYGLNCVGSMIWELIQQPRSVEAVCSAVLKQYDVDPETCSRDVLRVLEDLRAAGLAKLT